VLWQFVPFHPFIQTRTSIPKFTISILPHSPQDQGTMTSSSPSCRESHTTLTEPWDGNLPPEPYLSTSSDLDLRSFQRQTISTPLRIRASQRPTTITQHDLRGTFGTFKSTHSHNVTQSSRYLWYIQVFHTQLKTSKFPSYHARACLWYCV